MALALTKKTPATKAVTRARTKKSNILIDQFQKVFFSSQGFPLILMFSILGILFVLFRMKGVEQNYKISAINKEIERVALEGKELRAKKARMLSVKKLRKMATKYKLQQPKERQIIVVPN